MGESSVARKLQDGEAIKSSLIIFATSYSLINIIVTMNAISYTFKYTHPTSPLFLKDGFIDYLELLAAINLVIRGKIDQKLKWYFKLYDIDGSGTIDKKEVISILMVSKCTNLQG